MLIVLPAIDISSGVVGAQTPLALGGFRMLHNMAIKQGTDAAPFKEALQVRYVSQWQTQNGEHKLTRLTLPNLTVDFITVMMTFLRVFWMQSFLDNIEYRLGTRNTSQLIQLTIINNTYLMPPSLSRRYLELEAATESTWACNGSSSTGYAVTAASSIFPDCELLYSVAVYDIKWALQAQSIFGMARTLFLVCLLALGAYFIHHDTRRLVLDPVERMVERVREMAEDPLTQATIHHIKKGVTKLPAAGNTALHDGRVCQPKMGCEHKGVIHCEQGGEGSDHNISIGGSKEHGFSHDDVAHQKAVQHSDMAQHQRGLAPTGPLMQQQNVTGSGPGSSMLQQSILQAWQQTVQLFYLLVRQVSSALV